MSYIVCLQSLRIKINKILKNQYGSVKTSHILFAVVALIFGVIFVLAHGVEVFIDRMDGIFFALLAVICLDVITGIASAYIGKSPNSEDGNFDMGAFKRGIISKLLILIVVAMASIVDLALNNNLIRDVVILFYMCEEALSVLENCSTAGLPIPAKLVKMLEALEEDEPKKEG